MNSISVSYTLVFRFKDYPFIQVTKKGEIFNTKTGRRKKICYNGGSLGIWITPKKFITKSKLNNHIERIPKYEFMEDNFLTNFNL